MTNFIIDNTMNHTPLLILAAAVIAAVLFSAGCVTTSTGGDTITITDAAGRTVTVPDNPDRIAVSGSGSSRYFAWLQVTDRMTAVDYQDSSLLVRAGETRPYMLAHPEIKNLSVLGASKGAVDAEKLLAANPQVLFMSGVSDTNIQTANELTEKTGIPVVLFYSGDYVRSTDKVEESLRIIAKVLHVDPRAEAVISYFRDTRADLEARAAKAAAVDKPVIYVGGVSYNGAHGITGTDPTYYAFTVLSANNAASVIQSSTSTGYAEIAKEQLLAWDPAILIIDLNTMEAAGGGAIYELQNDPSYSQLSAVKSGSVYAVNPHTSMGTNHETSMANAYYIGKLLYPDQFADIDPAKKADEIYTFMDGAPVYEQLKANMKGLSYAKLEL